MNTIEIYRQAIKRTFADVFEISPDSIDVTWSDDGETIIVNCAGLSFTHRVLSDTDDNAPTFFGADKETAVTVSLTDEECRQLEGAVR
jgi:hypothetical protein